MSTETRDEAILNRGTALLIDEATLQYIGPRGGRKNLQGEDLAPPEGFMTFSADAQRFEGKVNALWKLYKQKGAVRIWIEFTEQLDHGLARKDKLGPEIEPRPRLSDPLGAMPLAQQNGNGKAHDSTHVDDVDDAPPPEHIGEAIKDAQQAGQGAGADRLGHPAAQRKTEWETRAAGQRHGERAKK